MDRRVQALFFAFVLLLVFACGTTGTKEAARPTLRATFTLALPTNTPSFTDTPILPTDTLIPPTDTPIPPTDTPILPTDTPISPTDTAIPTDTPIPPTDTSEPPTATPEPTQPPPPTEIPSPAPAKMVIALVDKKAEYVDIKNVGGLPQDLNGWELVSEKGDQRCKLAGVIQPGQTLRIWALADDQGKGGYNCGFGSPIWNNSEPDPAVLYDEQGREVDRK